MTVDEFYAFTGHAAGRREVGANGGRADLECLAKSVAPVDGPQRRFVLMIREREIKAPLGRAARSWHSRSEMDRPEPDVLVIPSEHRRPDGRRDLNDVIVILEALSPSTEKRDLGWKRKAYTSLWSLTHCIAAGCSRSNRVCARQKI
jgi:hypothetical protein